MGTMLFEVHDAHKKASATADKAKKAAEALAAHENRSNKVAGDLNQLKGMVGFNPAMSAGILLEPRFSIRAQEGAKAMIEAGCARRSQARLNTSPRKRAEDNRPVLGEFRASEAQRPVACKLTDQDRTRPA